LFRRRTSVEYRNNLLVFVTPRVVEQGTESDAVGAALEQRAGMPDVSRPIRAPVPRE
jgi:type II secretory pathway component GspD/PulD (secretin)